ncbi:Bug family tripartite tricarboxylate transporter substrate binding protein [Undibacter mobilis]|uniref:Tripartite tricarboxylate transporter substrate binding protein n=1 Tax=Undibacter mobilis TaxID=2292256 RepID=A0A371BAF0_9BRAD|nr:tripartite tricarboxylate transporter substrate binding protein [Undibacter mobilis]RDV04558.1 tripartite tricarboxylate transporter substrate binding protein [Undibacter mobilis]
MLRSSGAKGLIGFFFTVLLCLAQGQSAARAEDVADFPSHNIRIVCAFGAGGPPDVVARVVAQGLSVKLGKPVIVENISGASGMLAARTAARSAPDGYTLMVVDMSFIVARHAVASFDINPLEAFKSVGLAARSPFTLIVDRKLPVATAAEFVALTKSKPEAAIVGHTGIGTTPHLGYLAFATATGTKSRLIPYRNIGDALNNIMSGDIHAAFSAASTAASVQGSDKLKVLAVTGDKRIPQLPNIPTFAEGGIVMKGFEEGAWYGFVAPAGTPDAIVNKLNAALNEVVKDQSLRERLVASGVELTSGTPADFAKFMASQDQFWGKTLKDAGITPN